MSLALVVGPAAEPISLAEAKRHLRIDDTSSDTHVAALIMAARDHVETYCRRALITRTLDWRLDHFPASGSLYLPSPPLRSVTSITYVDTAGATQTWTSTLWTSDIYSEPGRIQPAYGEVWPSTREQPNAATIRFKAGYATKFTATAADDILTAAGHVLATGDLTRLYMSGPESVAATSSVAAVGAAALPAGLAENTDYYAVTVVAATSTKLSLTSGGAAVDITGAGTGTGSQFYLGVIPRPILDAMLLMLTHWYENRGPVNIGNIVNEIPMSARALLSPYRVLTFG